MLVIVAIYYKYTNIIIKYYLFYLFQTNMTDENIPDDLNDRDVNINEVTIEVEREVKLLFFLN